MRKVLARVLLPLMGTGIAHQAASQAATDSLHRDSANSAAVASAATPAAAGPDVSPMVMPVDVRGYRLTDSLQLGGDAGTHYTYIRHKTDKIEVFVVPFTTATSPQTTDDTVAVVEGHVDRLRQSLDEAFKRGDLSAFQSMREHRDDLRAAGRTVRGFMMLAALTHRGGGTAQLADPLECSAAARAGRSGRCPPSMGPRSSDAPATGMSMADVRGFQAYMYYAAYALPQSVILVRAEMPQQSAASDEAPDFAHKTVAAMVATH